MVLNQLGRARLAAVSVLLNRANVDVLDADGNVLVSQVAPVWTGVGHETSTSSFEIWFQVQVPAIGSARVDFVPSQPASPTRHVFSSVEVRHAKQKASRENR